MKQINFRLVKSDVLTNTALHTAYFGAKRTSTEDPEAYDRIATIDEDDQLLATFWEEAGTQLLELYIKDTASSVVNDSVIEFTLNVTDNTPPDLQKVLHATLVQYILLYTLARWFMFTHPQEAELYTSLYQSKLVEAQRLFFKRTFPSRKEYNDKYKVRP